MQNILDKTINIISIQDTGLLIHSTCLHPFYSPDNKKVAFWVQDYDYLNGVYLSTYQLYVKDIITNGLNLVNTGNGNCPLPSNTSPNFLIHNAHFSPDSTKILFLTTSTNLVLADSLLYSSTPTSDVRWYVKNLTAGAFTRVASSNTVYGNDVDSNEALWVDANRVVFVSKSLNVFPNLNQNTHSEVYLKDLTDNSLTHVSIKDGSYASPYFISSNINIAVGANKVSFYSYELGYVIKDLSDGTLIRVQDLTDIDNYGVVTPSVITWSPDGTKILFRISSGTTITVDTNGLTDDFVYDFVLDTIIPINESTDDTVYGNGYSKNSAFTPDGDRVTFISNSYNIDPSSTNSVDNLYVKDLYTRSLTRISKSISNGNITNNVTGYVWLSDDKVAFTSFSNDLVSGDTNTDVDWFVRYPNTNTTKRINFNDALQVFSENNNYIGNIRRETFDIVGDKILFSAKLLDIDNTFYTPGLNDYGIFEKTVDDHLLNYPAAIGHDVVANDSINANVNDIKLDQYTSIDAITGTPTFSIVGSNYVERVNSILNKNDLTNIRWMSFNYPNLPYNTPVPAKLGMGIFKATPTLLDDIIDVKQNGETTTINPTIGVLTTISVRPQNDVLLVTAGADQQRICDAIVYLEASVLGNMSGHTFLWELIDGDNVVIVQNSQTQAWYTSDSTASDRVFRFWIDKGKFNQQYNDVTIYSTPTDFLVNDHVVIDTDGLEVSVSDDPNLYVDYHLLVSSDVFDISVPFNSSGAFNLYSTGVEWTLPLVFYGADTDSKQYYRSNFKATVLEINVNGVWENVATKYVNDQRLYTPIAVGSLARVGAVYTLFGKNVVYYSDVFVPESTLTANLVLSELSIDATLDTTRTNTIYSITPIDNEDNITISNTSIQTDVIYNRTNTIYSLYPIPTEDTILISEVDFDTGYSFTIFRYNGAVIGG